MSGASKVLDELATVAGNGTNGATVDQVSQAGQGLATAFHGTIEMMVKTIENHERENFNKKMGNNFAGASKILNKIGVVGAP